MIETTAKPNNTIAIGYAGENEARKILLDYPSEWTEEFPGGTVALHVKRAGDGAVYTAAEISDDRTHCTLSWTITTTETSYAGRGEAQLCFIDNGAIVKSQRYSTLVEQSTSTVTPTEPPPDELIAQAVEDYIAEHVDVVTVSDHGEDGQLLQSDGDGSYSWLTVTDPIVDSDTGATLVPTRALNRLANAIRAKTHYEGDLTVETMADVLEQTDMWTTEEYCLNLAPAAAELTITLGALPAYALVARQNISKVMLPYCGRINASAFLNSAVAIVSAPLLSTIEATSFQGCTALTTVNFPNLLSMTGASVFSGCTSLVRAEFPKMNEINSNIFYNCFELREVDLPKVERVYNFSSTVDYIFQNCRSIQTISLPKFAAAFRTGNCDGCWALEDMTLPKLTQITSNFNFRNCYALEKLYAPECTVWTGTQNFLNCNSLRRMCFYTKPTSISNTLFSGAPALEDIYVSWAQNEVAGAPWGAPTSCTVHYDTTYDEDGEPIV